jgi:hypothetical protein
MSKARSVAKKNDLDSRQISAVAWLLSGLSQKATARKAGVGEDAISNWVNHNFAFQAELARRQEAIIATDVRRICHYRSLALQRLRQLLKSPDEAISLGAAKELLKVGGYSSGEVTINVNSEPTESPDTLRAELERLQIRALELGRERGLLTVATARDAEATLLPAPEPTNGAQAVEKKAP